MIIFNLNVKAISSINVPRPFKHGYFYIFGYIATQTFKNGVFCLHTRLKLADDNGNLLNRKNVYLASFFGDL